MQLENFFCPLYFYKARVGLSLVLDNYGLDIIKILHTEKLICQQSLWFPLYVVLFQVFLLNGQMNDSRYLKRMQAHVIDTSFFIFSPSTFFLFFVKLFISSLHIPFPYSLDAPSTSLSHLQTSFLFFYKQCYFLFIFYFLLYASFCAFIASSLTAIRFIFYFLCWFNGK